MMFKCPLVSLFDLLLMIGKGLGTWWCSSKCPLVSLFDMLLTIGKGLRTWLMFPLCLALFRCFIGVLEHGSFHFVPCIPSFWGALVFFHFIYLFIYWLGRVSSSFNGLLTEHNFASADGQEFRKTVMLIVVLWALCFSKHPPSFWWIVKTHYKYPNQWIFFWILFL